MSVPVQFKGSIPQNYEDYLTPFLFDPYADDLLARIDFSAAKNILELAAGTGSVTKKLLPLLGPDARLTATDLQADMLTVAQRNITSPNVTWDLVDMTAIQYKDSSFDVIVCQFGLMLVPEKIKALTEIQRVLSKHGKFVFNVWGNIAGNEVWRITGEVVHSFIGINPFLVDPGPFSMKEDSTVTLLEKLGFDNIKVTTVNKTGVVGSASIAAKGFIQGLPILLAISQKDPSLIPQVQEKVEAELIKQLGDNPMRTSLQALVFEAGK